MVSVAYHPRPALHSVRYVVCLFITPARAWMWRAGCATCAQSMCGEQCVAALLVWTGSGLGRVCACRCVDLIRLSMWISTHFNEGMLERGGTVARG